MPRQLSYRVLRDITSPHENRPDRHYQIREGRDGTVYCSCLGWRFRQTCRHPAELLLEVKYWNVYNHGQLVGKVTGTSDRKSVV